LNFSSPILYITHCEIFIVILSHHLNFTPCGGLFVSTYEEKRTFFGIIEWFSSVSILLTWPNYLSLSLL
jgi:hypothetical protein